MMEDNTPCVISFYILAPWPIVAATFEVAHRLVEPNPKGTEAKPTADEYRATVYLQQQLPSEWGTNDPTSLGTIQMKANGDNTQIVITTTATYEKYWHLVMGHVNAQAEYMKRYQRLISGVSMNDAIEYYYRSRASGSNITLRAVAEQFSLSYEALKKHKQRYDAGGQWGSKKKASGDKNVPEK